MVRLLIVYKLEPTESIDLTDPLQPKEYPVSTVDLAVFLVIKDSVSSFYFQFYLSKNCFPS